MQNTKTFPAYYPITAKEIVKVKNWWLRIEAADAFESMRNAYQALFPHLKFVITDAGRTHAQQIDVYRRKPGLAAKPGNSWHESGAAVDVDVKRIKRESGWNQDELEAFCEKYNFHRTVAAESWHFEWHTDDFPRNNKTLKEGIRYIDND